MKSYSMTFITVTLSVLHTQDVAQYKNILLLISCVSIEMEMCDSVQQISQWRPASIETWKDKHYSKGITTT